jgi:hypothetical protein
MEWRKDTSHLDVKVCIWFDNANLSKEHYQDKQNLAIIHQPLTNDNLGTNFLSDEKEPLSEEA